MQGQHELTDWQQPVQVASVQTLMRRKLPPADVVVIDEAHAWFKFYGTWMADPAWQAVPFVGLSATPWTKGLGKHYDDLLIAATTSELIDGSFLSRFRVFAPSTPDLSDVSIVRGDFAEAELSAAMQPLVADVVEQWLARAENRPTLCFAVDRAHAKLLQQRFDEAGVSTGYIDAYTSAEEREAIAGQFKRGQTQVVCNVGCLTTGIDWDVRCIVLARPTRSEILYTQIIGRGLRTAEGKADCLILDHSDTTRRLGFVTDIHHTTLDTGRERGDTEPRLEALPKACPVCQFLKPPKMALCPACGFKAERQCEIEHVEGDLVEMVRAQTPASANAQDKQRYFSMLLQIAEDRGYRPGWAAASFKDKFGHWPDGLPRFPIEPEADVLAWVRSKLIRYAKRRAA